MRLCQTRERASDTTSRSALGFGWSSRATFVVPVNKRRVFFKEQDALADLGLASSISFAEQRTSSMTDKCQIPRLDARFGLLSLRMKRLLRGDWSVSLAFLLMILAVGEVPCPAQEQVRDFTVHTGSLNLDFTVGRSFSTVASAQTDPLEFGTDSAISGPGGITAGAAMGVSISPWLLFMAEASYVAGGRRQYDFGAGFTRDSLTSAWVYEAGVHFRYRAT